MFVCSLWGSTRPFVLKESKLVPQGIISMEAFCQEPEFSFDNQSHE
jgi:hypothetical protein